MKTFLKILSTAALALVLFVPAKSAFSADFPAGTTFKNIVGKVLEPHAADKVWTTLDAIDFGFMTKYVRVCMWPESALVYLRMNTTVANTIALGVADTNLLLFPGTSSTVFIDGTTSYDFGAMPMRAAVSADGTAAPQFSTQTTCITEPWATRGIIAHVVSGLATIDVWGYR